jgi:membrane carboxypeptidase/penicillin-binding protein
MNTTRVLRTILKGGVLLLCAVIAAVVIQFGWSYFRAPQLISQFERSRLLLLEPSQFGKTRLEWLLMVDDPNFYTHHGVDGRTRGAGYTTITQGIVKYLFFDHFAPGLFRWRKVKQTIIAVAFNARVSKQEQLRLFANTVYLGTRGNHDIRGFSEASEAYYGRPFMELNDEEYLGLVAMIVAPAKYSLAAHPDQNHERVQRIRRFLAKECEPVSVGDVEYSGCAK